MISVFSYHYGGVNNLDSYLNPKIPGTGSMLNWLIPPAAYTAIRTTSISSPLVFPSLPPAARSPAYISQHGEEARGTPFNDRKKVV